MDVNRPPDDQAQEPMPYSSNFETGPDRLKSGPSDQLSLYAPDEPGRTGPQLVPSRTAQPATASPVAIWIDRLALVIKVVFYIELGMLLAILPWTRVWTDNSFVMAYPKLRALLLEGWLRGAVSGIGLLDIWIGIWEAVHYRDRK